MLCGAEQWAATRPGESGYSKGDVLAERYTLLRPLRSGGMGIVWVALSRALDVDVALKLLPASMSDPERIERMSREARAAARLGHPAIVRVLDFGMTESGQPFLAMELLEGEELHTLLQREVTLPASEAAAVLLPIIDGLACAHLAGIVHRDVKPENIFLSRDDFGRIQPKLLDFGIAKLNEERPRRLTESGTLLGTPQYLSPEQAYGQEDVDFRSDVWSIGVVLYELVTGVPPFDGNNYNAVLRSVIEDEPLPTTDFDVGDEAFWRIIQRCLRKERAERWPSTWELGQELALWLMGQGIESDAAARSLRGVWFADGEKPREIVEAPRLSSGVRTKARLLLVDETLDP